MHGTTRLRFEPMRRSGRTASVRLPRAFLGGFALIAAVVAALLGSLPVFVALGYVLMAPVSFALYWHDKVSAMRSRQRTPEATLHLADLLGGWPGGLIAQQVLRHKTAKTSYQVAYWLTVIANLSAVAFLMRSGSLPP